MKRGVTGSFDKSTHPQCTSLFVTGPQPSLEQNRHIFESEREIGNQFIANHFLTLRIESVRIELVLFLLFIFVLLSGLTLARSASGGISIDIVTRRLLVLVCFRLALPLRRLLLLLLQLRLRVERQKRMSGATDPIRRQRASEQSDRAPPQTENPESSPFAVSSSWSQQQRRAGRPPPLARE